METTKHVRGEVLLAAQQISLAKVLAANDKAVRDKGVKRLGKWIAARSDSAIDFTQQDLMTIWKGLFYCMWMADKPLYQEELAERISRLIHCFKNLEKGLLYAECFFLTMRREWFGIDQYRLDKFMMLVRRCIRQMFTYCSSHSWSEEACEGITGLLERGITSSAESTPSMGLLFHVSDVILEELAKVESPEKGLQAVLGPFASLIANSTDARIRQHISERIFHHLIQQSPLGIEFQEKFEAWKQAGFPGDSWRDMELVEVSDEEQQQNGDDTESESAAHTDVEKHLDPRAGKVDVELPLLDFDAGKVSALLKSQLQKTSNMKQRKALNMLATQFSELATGKYPLGFKKPEGATVRRNRARHQEGLWKAAEDLIEFEEELLEKGNNAEEMIASKPGKKRKSQNDIDKCVQNKRRKSERSALAETEKCNGNSNDQQSSSTTLNKSSKNLQNNSRNNKTQRVPNKIGTKQKLQKNARDKLHNTLLEPEHINTMTFPEESDRPSPEKISKRKSKTKCEGVMAVESPVTRDNSPFVIKEPIRNKKCKQKEESKSISVVQNDENSLLQSSTNLPGVTPNTRKTSNLQTSIGGTAEQKILHEYSSRYNLVSPGKKKPNGLMQEKRKFFLSDTKQNFRNGVIGSGKKMSLRRSLTLEQCPSRITPKKRNSLSTWIVTEILQDSASTKVSKTENVESSSTCTSVLPRKPSESMSSLVQTPKSNTCPAIELPDNTPEAVNRSVENPKSAKKVNIVLNKNIAHEARDYPKAVKQSPNIPFDASKKPVQGVLKPGFLPSPVNPFFRKSKRLKL